MAAQFIKDYIVPSNPRVDGAETFPSSGHLLNNSLVENASMVGGNGALLATSWYALKNDNVSEQAAWYYRFAIGFSASMLGAWVIARPLGKFFTFA